MTMDQSIKSRDDIKRSVWFLKLMLYVDDETFANLCFCTSGITVIAAWHVVSSSS